VARHIGWVFGKYGDLVHVALFEANALAVLEIDCGYEQHGYCEITERMVGLVRSALVAAAQGFQCTKFL
jgi:hypothetical protein